MRKSFTWLLSLFVTLGFMGIFFNGYADETQETVELYAGTTTACYNESNEYLVNVSVRDFIRLTKFDLNLAYPASTFDFVSATPLAAWTGGTVTVTESAGVINFNWVGSETTIGNNVKTDVFQLKFKLDGYPNLIANSFTGALTWSAKNFWYTIAAGPTYDAVNTVISSNGSLNVTQSYPVANIETTFVSETCAGGQAKVKVTSPASVLYSFNNGAFTTSNEFAALPGNNVSIKVKDSNGCVSHTKTVTVPQTLLPVTFTVASTNPTCYGADASVFVTATGGTGPYTYYYNTTPSVTGAVTRTNFQFNVPTATASATTYYIGVQDANECVNLNDANTWTTVTVNDLNTAITSTATVNSNVKCNGGSTGSATVTISPAAEYWVALNGGSWVKTATNGTKAFTGLAAGTYTVTAKTASDCTVESAYFTITQPDAMTLAIVIDDTSCGGINDGTVSVTVTGGTAPYTYKLAAGTWSATQISSSPVIFTGLQPIYYSLVITDAQLCTISYDNPNGTGNVIAVQSPTDINITSAVVTNPSCYGGTGTITITATGGSGSYLYSVNGGTTSQTSNVFGSLAVGGTYTVTVMNKTGVGCPVSLPNALTVTQPTQLNAVVAGTLSPVCADGSDGDITLNISGGTIPYKYKVNNGPWVTNVGTVAHIAVTVGTHTITVTDNNSCAAVELVQTITQSTNSITATSSHVILCNGEKDGTISTTVTTWAGNRTGQIFKYASAAADVYTTGQTFIPAGTASATTFVAGTYYVGAIDAYGCKATPVKVDITQKPVVEIVSVASTGASCFNSFDGTISISAKGGNSTNTTTEALQYAIVNEGITTIPSTSWINFPNYAPSTKVFSVTVQVGKGKYQVAVKDQSVCNKVVMHTQTIEVTGYDQLKIDETKIVVTKPLCFGQKGQIEVPAAAVSGGSGTYKYTLLRNGSTVTTTTTQQPTGVFGGLATGTTYQIKLEDSMGCPSYTTANISITEPEVLAFTIDKKEISCNGANDGLITINVTGGTHSDTSAATQYKYAVNNQNLWVPFVGTSKQYIATLPGTYTIWVKDANECTTVSQTVTISQPSTVTATVTVTNASCNNGTGSIVISNVGGGWSGSVYSYKINNGAVTATGTPTTTVSSLPAGNHTLTVYAAMAADGTHQSATCSVAIPFTITQPEPISYDVAVTNVHCKGGNDGALTVTVLGGGTASTTGGYQVRVTGPGYDKTSWTGTDKVHAFTGMTTGMYTVYITDKNGCTTSSTVNDKVAPYYTVESWEVQEPATALGVSATRISNAKCDGAANGVFTITANGGVAPYKFYTAKSILPDHIILPDADNNSAWIGVEGSTYTKTDASAGTWIVWAQDANGCIVGGEDLNGVPVNAWRVQITDPDPIQFAVGAVVSATCSGKADGTITVSSITGGTPSYTVTVSGVSKAGAVVSATKTMNAGSITVTGLPASDGYYTISVADVNGCTATYTATRTVNEPAPIAVTLTAAEGSFTCPGAVEGWIEAKGTGGAGTYEYKLYKDGVQLVNWTAVSTFFVQIGHTYKVEVKNVGSGAGTCTATAEVTINEPLPVEASIKETTCYGDPNASVVVKATGEPGRTFSIRYRLNTASYPSTWTAMPNGELAISGLLFSNVNVGQNFYFFEIKDNKGCTTELTNKSFVATQHPLQVTLTQTDLNAAVTITGGISPYTYQVGSAAKVTLAVSNNEFQVVNLKAGQTTVTVWDAHGCLVTNTVTVAPLSVTAVPASGSNQMNSFPVVLTFSRNVDAATVNSSTVSVSGTGTPTVTIAAGTTSNVYTATITGVDKADVTLALSNGIMDAAGNTLSATSFTYTIGDHVSPTVVVTGPTGTVSTTFTVGLEFSEAVSGVAIGTGVTVTGGTATVTGSGMSYSLAVTAAEQTKVTIALTDAIKDLSANANKLVAKTVEYTTGDFTAPTLVSKVPSATTINDNHPKPLSFTLSEAVKLSTAGGSLKITKVGATAASVTVPLTSAMISGSVVSVTYTSGLDKNTDYFVTVDADALEDLAGNKFAGITASNTWTFKTGANFATPVDVVNGSLKVYPNPFVDYVNVVTTSEMSKVVVTNIAGQVVKEVVNPSNTIQLDGLRSGVYFISIYDRDAVIGTAKIVKR